MYVEMRADGNNTKGFVTIAEAAELVGLSHWTIRMWLRKGWLTRYKSASRTIVSRPELIERVEPKRVEEKR